MAANYRAKMAEDAVSFDAEVQRHLIEEAIVASGYQQFRCHFLATESTHLHALVSWKMARTWEVIRAKLRESLTRRLNREIERRDWFSKSPSRKRVRDRKHFDYLMQTYLPKHSGLKWCEGRGIFQ
jgi:hypothetical protein